MHISSATHSVGSINNVLATEIQETPHQFPKEISIRLRTLNLLSDRIIGETAPKFCKIIYYLDQPNSALSYQKCEILFEDAFIKEFSPDEISLFLNSFFEKFDPEEEFICYKNLNNEGQQFLWENIIKYYCYEYIGFETKTLSLEAIFNHIQEKFDPDKKVIKKSISGLEGRLEKNFDLAMDVIPQFSGDELVEMKLLLISYSALLISSLKKVEESRNPNLILDNAFSIQDLFEEIYALLLQLPFLPKIDAKGVANFHTELDQLSPEALKERFLKGLINYLLDRQDPLYEENAKAIYDVMSKCYFLDFEYKDFLQNITEDNIRKS